MRKIPAGTVLIWDDSIGYPDEYNDKLIFVLLDDRENLQLRTRCLVLQGEVFNAKIGDIVELLGIIDISRRLS